MKTLRLPLFLSTVLGTVCLSLSACKTRTTAESNVANFTFDANQPLDMFAPLTDGELNHSLIFKEKSSIVKFTVSQAGFGTISVGASLRNSQTPLVTTAPEAYLLRVGQESTPLVSGTIPVDSSGDFEGEMLHYLEVGDYYLVVDHHGLMKDTYKMNFGISETFPSNSIDDNSAEVSQLIGDGESIEFDLKGDGDPMDVEITGTILESLPTIVPVRQIPQCKLGMNIFFDENGNTAPAEIDVSGAVTQSKNGCRFTSEGGVLKVGKRKHGWKFTPKGLTGKALVTGYVYTSSASDQKNTPIAMIPVEADESADQEGKYEPNSSVGFELDSKDDQIKFELNVGIRRTINSSLGLTPISKVSAKVVAPDGSIVIEKDLTADGLSFEGVLPAVMGNGKYKLEVIFPQEITKDDYISMSVSAEKAKLLIPDHINPISSFTDGAPMALPPPNVYTVDTQGSLTPSTFTPASPTKPFAARTLLESMEKIRNTFHVATERGVTQTEANYVDEGSIVACLGNVAEHWSDLMIHYYCQYGRARSCYTGTLRSQIDDIKNDQNLTDPQKLAKLQTIRENAFNTCAATAAKDKEWAWIMANQATDFRYVMDSQTFAFDFAEQQKIINEFYRVQNPNSKTECKAKRPKRNIDKTDGTHCRLNKAFRVEMKAVAR